METQKIDQHGSKGTLYLVPTPIGNLEDMTFRAVKTLKNVTLIAAEDTRNTQKLLNHFEIDTKQISFHEHNTQQRLPQLLEKLQRGQSIAQVSDAGMPSISDPGKELVAACISADIPVVPLPGPNAGLTALIASGIEPQPFLFYGFLPRKKSEQRQALQNLKNETATMIFYESPFRIEDTLQNMAQVFEPKRQVVVARELTKKFEEFIRSDLGSIAERLTQHVLKGEFVLIVAGADGEMAPVQLSDAQIIATIQAEIDRGVQPNVAIKTIAKQVGRKKQVIYNLFHQI
ncbi:16S rRNA (cytidine(1402)-2'-O)-methyltransferase [Lactobacillus sp. CC-MHH1034]|uniref:16S rRNA (cytidine(1402)-2'-O)-methyltransferase n=1 Tax=Agrilactobacillus fermenti TaxID=2586909 RepID=UPI001E35ECE4|nr:16S rRNA (cytidine(1402)-2'-O)-methyltransferase [Agrilactobacillus fermenti]MCD2255450.1 16S rRNA (cytidine(1402)-2'-O)-methyltransferase [Agrilactobacillus fermenti]